MGHFDAMNEIPAKGQRGFLLYNPFDHKYFFRVYAEDRSFVDYDLCVEDLEIEILDKFTSLYKGPERNRLDYNVTVRRG